MAACDCIINQRFSLPKGFDPKDTDIVVDAGGYVGFLVPNLKTTYSVIVEDAKGKIFLRHGTYTILRQIHGKLYFVSPKIDEKRHKIPIEDLPNTINTMIAEWELEKPGQVSCSKQALQITSFDDENKNMMIIVSEPFTDTIIDLKSPYRTAYGYRQIGDPMPIHLFKLFVVCYPGFIVDAVRPKFEVSETSSRILDEERGLYIGTSGLAVGVVFRKTDGINVVVGFGPRLNKLAKRQVADLMLHHANFVVPYTRCKWITLQYEPASPHAQYRTVSRGPLTGLIVEIKDKIIFAVGMNERLGYIPPKIVEIINRDYNDIVVAVADG